MAFSEESIRVLEYHDLQLCFSEVMAQKLDCLSSEAALLYTNFYRRLGLGSPVHADRSTVWQSYSSKLDQLKSYEEKLAWTQATFLNAPRETLPSDQKQFGHFLLEVKNDGKTVRSHFYSIERHEVSPLHPSQLEARKQELKALFSYVQESYPYAEEVVGASWLYNTRAYQSLFPQAYIESRQILSGMTRFQGSSSWGQFLTYKGGVKPNLRNQFLDNLKMLDTDKLWEAFPLPTLVLSAPLKAFYNHYDLIT